MGRRRDEGDPRCAMAQPRDLRRDLGAGELAPFAGLGALGHLDLDLLRVGEVLDGDAEPRTGHLLDGAVAVLAIRLGLVACGVLAPFARVAGCAQPIHGDGDGLVDLAAEGAMGHGTGAEPSHDGLDGLHLIQRHRISWDELQEAPQRRAVIIDDGGETPVQFRIVLPHRPLQQGDGLGTPEMALAVHSPCVLAAVVQLQATLFTNAVGVLIPQQGFPRDYVQTGSTNGARNAGEVGFHHLPREAHGLEELGAAIAGQRGDTHLGHDLQQPLLERQDVVVVEGFQFQAGLQLTLVHHVADAFQRQIRIHAAGTEPAQQTDVGYLAGLAAFHHEARGAQQTLHQEMLVKGRDRHQTWDRHAIRSFPPIAEDQHGGIVLQDGPVRLSQEPSYGRCERLPRLHRIQRVRGIQRDDLEIRPFQGLQLGHVLVAEDRVTQFQHPAVLGAFLENIVVPARKGEERHHEAFPLGIQRRVRDLGEHLLEVVEEQLRALAEYRQGRVRTHGTHGFLTVQGHGGHDSVQIFLGVTEGPKPRGDGALVVAGGRTGSQQASQGDAILLQPAPIGLLPGDAALDLVVVENAALGGVGEDHPSRPQLALHADALGFEGDDTGLAGHDEQTIGGDDVAAGPQAAAVEGPAHHDAIREDHGGRAIPGFHEGAMVLIEAPQVLADLAVLGKGLGDHHHHAVGQ